MPNYGLTNLIKATGQSFVSLAHLQNGDIAASLLPPDTQFAIVIEAIQKGINDSFWETDTNVATMSMQVSGEGMIGRFLGYLSFSDSKIRIYQALDINAAASGLPSPDLVSPDDAGSLQLLLEEDFTNIAVSLAQGEFVISNATQKFKLLQPYPISKLDGRFDSSATGFQGGLQPTLKYLQAHGVQTQGVVKQSNRVGIILLIIFVLGFAAVIILSKR